MAPRKKSSGKKDAQFILWISEAVPEGTGTKRDAKALLGPGAQARGLLGPGAQEEESTGYGSSRFEQSDAGGAAGDPRTK